MIIIILIDMFSRINRKKYLFTKTDQIRDRMKRDFEIKKNRDISYDNL